MVKKAGGDQIIGVVGGVKIPPVDSFLAGYQAGAKKCDPGIKVLKGYSQDFVATDKCKTVAENQIAQGAQVLFQVAGGCGLGTLKAADQANRWGIGVDVDQYRLAKRVLTSGIKRVDNGVFDAIDAVQAGDFEGGRDLVFDLKNGGVGLGKTSPKVPKSILRQVDRLKAQIIAGTITPPTAVKSG
jgi:basic membrane protein A